MNKYLLVITLATGRTVQMVAEGIEAAIAAAGLLELNPSVISVHVERGAK